MTRNDICARYFGSDQTQCSTHSAPFDSPSESRCSAARLSHDRGADAAMHEALTMVMGECRHDRGEPDCRTMVVALSVRRTHRGGTPA